MPSWYEESPPRVGFRHPQTLAAFLLVYLAVLSVSVYAVLLAAEVVSR